MSYIDTRMPRRLSAGFRIGPEWKTRIVPMANGREQRNKEWLYPRWRGQGNLGAFNAADRQALISMFVAVGGRWGVFRVYDPTDYMATAQTLSVSVGTTDAAQLTKTYSHGTQSQSVLIQAPVAGTLSITKDGNPFTAYTVDSTTGLVTPDAAWGAGTYLATFQHDRWMRFDSDWGAFTANHQGAWTADIELVEVRRPTS